MTMQASSPFGGRRKGRVGGERGQAVSRDHRLVELGQFPDQTQAGRSPQDMRHIRQAGGEAGTRPRRQDQGGADRSQVLKPGAPRGRLGRWKPCEQEAVGRQARHGQGGERRGRAGDGIDWHALRRRCAGDVETGVGNQRCAGIGDQGDARAAQASKGPRTLGRAALGSVLVIALQGFLDAGRRPGSLPVTRVSSARIRSHPASTSRARRVMSRRLPIGVATR